MTRRCMNTDDWVETRTVTDRADAGIPHGHLCDRCGGTRDIAQWGNHWICSPCFGSYVMRRGTT